MPATTTAVPTAKPTLAPKPFAAKPAPKAPLKVAPADEYFGKLKISVLGIRNTIKDVGANIEIDQTRWMQQASKAAFAEEATRDWEHKYPTDTWLAKTVFALERMYAKLDTDEGRKRSLATMQWLVRDFPATWYGKAGKKELAQGKVGHAPLNTAAVPAPSPTATAAEVAAPEVSPSSTPSVTGSSSMNSGAGDLSGQPAPTASPEPLPSATPPLLNPP